MARPCILPASRASGTCWVLRAGPFLSWSCGPGPLPHPALGIWPLAPPLLWLQGPPSTPTDSLAPFSWPSQGGHDQAADQWFLSSRWEGWT